MCGCAQRQTGKRDRKYNLVLNKLPLLGQNENARRNARERRNGLFRYFSSIGSQWLLIEFPFEAFKENAKRVPHKLRCKM